MAYQTLASRAILTVALFVVIAAPLSAQYPPQPSYGAAPAQQMPVPRAQSSLAPQGAAPQQQQQFAVPATAQPAQPWQPMAQQAPPQSLPAGHPHAAAQGHPQQRPIYRVAANPEPAQAGAASQAAGAASTGNTLSPAQHPLTPALNWAKQGLPHIQSINDYQCRLYKRERVDGQLGDYQMMFVKVRHRPFSVYMYFEGPANLRGQEVIYVDGRNEGKLQAHATGLKNVVGTVSLSPTGAMAMRGNRYPITELGVANLVQRLIQVGDHDSKYGECDVQFHKAKVGNRSCTCITVTHPTPRRNFLFHIARIFVDDELNIPIRYEAYDWPARQGGEPQLLEEYTYQNIKINNGFTDQDFDVANPKYGFR